ncbi:MAG: hypothetical protein AB7O47_06810 [Flavobacteriales bacterium]
MIKYLILFIHLIGLSIYQLFFGDVTATQKIPDKIKAGEEVTVEVVITKEDVSGFAKFQQTLPKGFTVEVVDAKGATFSFKEDVVKFIWMALPADKEFTISYKIKSTQDLSGSFSIGGKFSYISDNERKNIDIPESSISIVKEEEIVEEVKEDPKTTISEVESKTEEPVVEIKEPSATITPAKVEIKTLRSIEKLGEKFKVTLKINQSNLEGFAKFTDVIPNGFVAVADNAEGGIFSFKDNEAKILWMAAPKKSEFTVSYFIEPNSDATDGTFDVSGYISYLENDVTQKYTINSTEFSYMKQLVAVEESPKTEPVIEESVVESKKTEPVKDNKITPVATSTPSGEKGVTYKIQVGAGHQNVSKNYFASKFNLEDAVSVESHDGWIKYIVGKYNEYKQARDKRNEVRNNIKNAFVTAYNQGKRITVQEALMISNQKWYQ